MELTDDHPLIEWLDKKVADKVYYESIRPTFEQWQQLLREPFITQRIPGRVWAGVNFGSTMSSDLRSGQVSPRAPMDLDYYFYSRELND